MKPQKAKGATPLDDLSDLIPDIVTRSQLNTVEAENILQAMDRHLRRRKNPKRPWMTERYMCRVHRDMFGRVWKWAGRFRDTEVNIGMAPHLIREEVQKLCDDVAFWDLQKKPMSVLERAIRIHHRLAYIHPFKNGNGRHARLIADIYLLSHGYPLPEWPDSDITGKGGTRDDYLTAMRAADNGNFSPLMIYVSQFIKP